MDRRDFLRTSSMFAAAAAVGAAAGTASAAPKKDEHAHHHAAAANGKNQALAKAALECEGKGQVCLDHCFESFKAGDTSLAGCAERVNEMMAVCQATAALANANSSNLPALAKVCAQVCEDCRKECAKHADKHAACKDCADACVAVIEACKAVAA